jgi:probable rRNA maturation factor
MVLSAGSSKLTPLPVSQAEAMITIDVLVEDDAWGAPEAWQSLAERAFGAAAAVAPGDGEVAVLLTHDSALQTLNAKFRGINKPTDVLSFAAAGAPSGFLGDVAIAFGVAARDADAQGKRFDDHIAHLLIHAWLHLHGHDHETPDEAARMEPLEILALAKLGIADPYELAAIEAPPS